MAGAGGNTSTCSWTGSVMVPYRVKIFQKKVETLPASEEECLHRFTVTMQQRLDMQGVRQILALTIGMLAGCLFLGCTSVKVVYRAPDFQHRKVVAGRIGIGGITPTDAEAYMEQDRLAFMLHQACQTRWRDTQVVPVEEIEQALGPTNYQRMLSAFGNLAVLDRQELERLRLLGEKVRYLMLLDIRQNEVSHGNSSGPEYARNTYYDSYSRSYYDTEYQVGYVSSSAGSRRLKCVFVVYDLQAGKPVWVVTGSARSTDSYSRSNPFLPPEISSMGAPPTSKLMDRILRRAVRKLPPAQ
jgi:hypothetical protein